jgi:hypothetical protein
MSHVTVVCKVGYLARTYVRGHESWLQVRCLLRQKSFVDRQCIYRTAADIDRPYRACIVLVRPKSLVLG